MKKLVLSFIYFVVTVSFSANVLATWYEGEVQEISSRGIEVERLYIKVFPDGKLESPNPAKCPGGFAGAAWITDGNSAKYAASIAIAALTTNRKVRLEIDDSKCYIDHPMIRWITLQ